MTDSSANEPFLGPKGRRILRRAWHHVNIFAAHTEAAGEELGEAAREGAKKAASAAHKITDFIEAAAVNAEHPYFKKSTRATVKAVFTTSAVLVGGGAFLVWGTSGWPAVAGYGAMAVGKAALFRGCRVFRPFAPHAPAKWERGSRVLAAVDFLEASSRNIAHPWMKPASQTNAKTKLLAGAAVGTLGFVMGVATVGVPSMLGTALYAGGGFVAYRAYRTLHPFNPTGTAPTGAAPSPSVG